MTIKKISCHQIWSTNVDENEFLKLFLHFCDSLFFNLTAIDGPDLMRINKVQGK